MTSLTQDHQVFMALGFNLAHTEAYRTYVENLLLIHFLPPSGFVLEIKKVDKLGMIYIVIDFGMVRQFNSLS